MSTSTKKGIPQTLILKSFLPHPTLFADNSLPLAAFDIDFFTTVTKEESDDSYQNILSTEKSLVKDYYQDLPIGDNMAEIEQDQHTKFLASIHSTSYSNDIAAFDQEMKPTHSSKCFWITSPSQTIDQDIPSQQTIASSEESNILPSNVPAKRKLHLDDQDNLRQDEIADMDRDEKLLIQTKRKRTGPPDSSSSHDIATVSDNTKSSSFGTEESSSFADAKLDNINIEEQSGASFQASRNFCNDTLQTLKSLDSASPPLPTDDEGQLRASSQPSILSSNNVPEGKVKDATSAQKNTEPSGTVSKGVTVKMSNTETVAEFVSSEEGGVTAERGFTRHADHRFHERNEECCHHTRRAIDDEHEGLTAVQQNSLAFDDLEDTKVVAHHEPVDSWQAYMEQQNFKDEKGHLISDQSNHLIQPHPSWKHHTISSYGFKKHSFPSSYGAGNLTHPYKPDFYPSPAPLYQHHPASSRKHSSHSTGHQNIPSSSSKNDARPQGMNEWRSCDLSLDQFAKKREYHSHHHTSREREHQNYPPYQDYDYQRHNSMYDYHDDLQPTYNFEGYEDNALPPVPPLSEAHYLSERGDNLVRPHDHHPYAIPISSTTNVFNHQDPYDYQHSSNRRLHQPPPPEGGYGSYNEHVRGYTRKNHSGYHSIDNSRQQPVNTYHVGRHGVFNSTSTSGYKSRSMDSGSTSSLSSSFYYSQQASGGHNGIQPYYNRQILALSTDDDENWLSEFLCFVRSQCVEVFSATREDVASRMNSKKVLLGQVGIRCRFCAHLPHRERTGRSSSFPSSISRIYQSLTMMLRDHFTKCHAMPPATQERYLGLKANASQGATDSKKYWIESANSLGLVDTADGIRFRNQFHPAATFDAEPLVILEEQEKAPEQEKTESMSSV